MPRAIEPTAAAVLKAIRDGSARTFPDLDRVFESNPSFRYWLRKTVGDLEAAGIIPFGDSGFSVSPASMKIQGVPLADYHTLHRDRELAFDGVPNGATRSSS